MLVQPCPNENQPLEAPQTQSLWKFKEFFPGFLQLLCLPICTPLSDFLETSSHMKHEIPKVHRFSWKCWSRLNSNRITNHKWKNTNDFLERQLNVQDISHSTGIHGILRLYPLLTLSSLPLSSLTLRFPFLFLLRRKEYSSLLFMAKVVPFPLILHHL